MEDEICSIPAYLAVEGILHDSLSSVSDADGGVTD